MAHREFADADGCQWFVWEVLPTPGAQHQPRVRREYAAGWLAFECAKQRRRLAPIPPGWANADETELRQLCARAVAFERRNRLIE